VRTRKRQPFRSRAGKVVAGAAGKETCQADGFPPNRRGQVKKAVVVRTAGRRQKKEKNKDSSQSAAGGEDQVLAKDGCLVVRRVWGAEDAAKDKEITH